MLLISILLLSLALQVASETLHLDFNITWVAVNPDGLRERRTIGVNDQWPPPRIEGNVGDIVVLNVRNLLEGQSTSLHLHGISMKGTPHMDGASGVSQCPILPGNTFQYIFELTNLGTYWYHAHDGAQSADGLRGLLIVRDPNPPYKHQWDGEIILSLSDWYHEQISDLGHSRDENETTLAIPAPDSILLNDARTFRVNVSPGTTYLVRVVNTGAFAGQYLQIADHEMVIVEVDGVYTEPQTTQGIYLAPGQRYSFLMTAKNETSANYPIITTLDLAEEHRADMTATGWIMYDSSLPTDDLDAQDPLRPSDLLDDMSLVPLDNTPLLDPSSRRITLDITMSESDDGGKRWAFNNTIYSPPTVPTLYTALATKQKATDPAIYGTSINPFVLHADEIVELIINNPSDTQHVFHLHGHEFGVMYRSASGAGEFDATHEDKERSPQTPMRRDTVAVNPGSSVVLRFKADNPGIWLLQSQIAWPSHSGLAVTFVESPLELQRSLSLSSIPIPFGDACAEGSVEIIMAEPLRIEGVRTPADSVLYVSLSTDRSGTGANVAFEVMA
ncbi:multicopper oxidase [Aspergillus carlsbadensis]|nr:multicopper oxidase [Aspergillus carlsbadensis]